MTGEKPLREERKGGGGGRRAAVVLFNLSFSILHHHITQYVTCPPQAPSLRLCLTAVQSIKRRARDDVIVRLPVANSKSDWLTPQLHVRSLHACWTPATHDE